MQYAYGGRFAHANWEVIFPCLALYRHFQVDIDTRVSSLQFSSLITIAVRDEMDNRHSPVLRIILNRNGCVLGGNLQ